MPEHPAASRFTTLDARGQQRAVRLRPGPVWRVLPAGSRFLLMLAAATLLATLLVPLLTELAFNPAGTAFAGWQWFGFAFPILLALQCLVQLVMSLRAPGAGDRLAAHHLQRSRCPACRYDLRGSRPDDRGITTCPECGATWSLASHQRSGLRQ